jgi:hypothetical protein
MTYPQLKKILVTTFFGAILLCGASIPFARADTTSDLQAQIQSLLQQLSQLKEVRAMQNGQLPGSCSLAFNRNMSMGSSGSDVLALQKFLNRDEETKVALYGAGAPGFETEYFGARTH